jgi:Protein kinase domain
MAVDQEGEPDTLVHGRLETVERDLETGIHGFYAYGDVIGKGGMGEVVLAHDRRIGRDVAIKRLKSSKVSDDDHARFLREARIQARLDHPAVVPVYELGRDEEGRPYFTMKRLVGVTLSEMIANPTTTLDMLALYLLAEKPARGVHAGEGFRLTDDGERRVLRARTCKRYEEDDFFFNPYGYWRLK